MHDRGPHEHKWRLSAIRALRDSLVVGQVMPRIYRIADIKVGLVFWKQTPSRLIPVHLRKACIGTAAAPTGSQRQDPCSKSPSTGRNRHRGGPWQSERFRAGVGLPMVEERLSQESMGAVFTPSWTAKRGPLMIYSKKTAAGTVEPVGGVCPSKEVWETLR